MNIYGLIGHPLSHSFSRRFFTEKFSAENIDAQYVNFDIPSIEMFPDIIKEHPNLLGLNVTIPYKQQVMQYMDSLSQEADAIGAVNVVKITRQEDGKVTATGHNSDVTGFTNSIRPLIKPYHRKALILGTGGASRAIHYGLQHKLGIECVFVSRTQKPGMITYEDINADILAEHEVIVNCTPCGMHPHTNEAPAIPYNLLTPQHLLYDLVYNPEETLFMKQGASYGATVKNGYEMLILQAIASWDIWNGQNAIQSLDRKND